MAELFKEGVPAQETPIRSAEIRDNFSALYDKLKTLEPRATTPESTQILINGGPVYFRAGASLLYNQQGAPLSGAQQLIQFKTSLIDLATANGFRTIKNSNGTLSKEPIFNGISPFESTGLYREILITVNSQGRLVFTEGATTTTGLSRPFDIAFDDSEIPICLVVVQQSGSLSVQGQLAPIRQIDITDIRPVITTAFQNNLTSTALQLAVEDNTARINAIEPVVKTNDNLRVRIPVIEKLSIDGTKTTNKKLEVLSGAAYIGGRYVRYPGGLVDVTQNLSTPLVVNHFNIALVTLDVSGSIVLYHGTGNSDKNLVSLPGSVSDGYGNLQPPTDSAPLALIYYRMESTEEVPASGTTTQIRPVVSEVFVDPTFNVDGDVDGGIRFNYAFDIVSINSPTEFVVNIPTDINITDVNLFFDSLTGLATGQQIDLLDDNSRPIRRTISNNPKGAYNSTTRNALIVVSETFVNDVSPTTNQGTSRGISLQRNPKAIAISKNITVLEDVRPTVMEI